MHDPNEEAAVVCAFLRRAAEDRDGAFARSLAEYQAMYPGFEAVVAREFAAWQTEREEPATEPPPSVIERLGTHCDPRVELLARSADEPRLRSTNEKSIGRYRDIGEIARGGMGSVHVVWDRDLRRRLAMKLLLDGAAVEDGATGDPRLLSRFLEEAQITSQLEHPSIVPVHELGIDDNGRVFFTMTLVRGRTFEEVIALVGAGDEDWPRTRALSTLQRVCEAVAFAHSRGVVHRDLKPSNIMVGRFGEVYVMDWGLARVVGATGRAELGDRAGNDSISTLRSGDTDASDEPPLRTLDGDVVGTACYMPPEQARGDIDDIGPGADVYAIGAVLYHLLAGRMPFSEERGRRGSRAVLERVLAGPPVPLQSLAPDAPAELIAICDKSMAREISDRYPDVRELGADLRAFLELRVVKAHATGAVAELRKWIRRNKSQAAVAAATVIALAGGLVFALAQADRATAAALRAETNFGLANDAVAELVRIGGAALANVPQVDGVRREMLQRALDFHLRFVEVRGGDFESRERAALAWELVANIRRQLGDIDGSEAASLASLELLDLLVRERPDRFDLLATRAWAHNTLGDLHNTRGEWEPALARFETASTLFVELIERDAGNPSHKVRQAHALHNTAVVHNWQNRFAEALAEMERELEIRRALVAAHPDTTEYRDHLATTECGIAFPLSQLGRQTEALTHLEASVREHARVLAAAPTVRGFRDHAALSWNQLGLAHSNARRGDEARVAFNESIRLRRELIRDFPHVPDFRSGLGMAENNLARVFMRQGDYVEAKRCAEEAVEAQAAALERMPDEPIFRRSMRNHHQVLLRCLSLLGDHRELARRSTELRAIDLGAGGWVEHTAGYHLARCTTLAVNDKTLTPAERRALIDDYASRAVVALRAAFDAGWTDWTLESTVYADTRRLDEFQALERDVQARAGKRDDGR